MRNGKHITVLTLILLICLMNMIHDPVHHINPVNPVQDNIVSKNPVNHINPTHPVQDNISGNLLHNNISADSACAAFEYNNIISFAHCTQINICTALSALQ